MKKTGIALILMCLALFAVSSQGSSPSTSGAGDAAAGEMEIPQDKRDNWTVAFCLFDTRALSTEESYLASSVPLLLKDGVSALHTHTLSEEEKLALRKSIIAAAVRGLYQSAAQLRDERDGYLFSASMDSQAFADAEKKLQSVLDRVNRLLALDAREVKVADEKPVQIKEGTGVGKLFDAPVYSIHQYAMEQDVDLLVGGTLSAVQGYVVIDLWAYRPVGEESVYVFHDAAQQENIYDSLAGALKGLVGAILGRQWASLTVIPDPAQSVISIDGKSLGAGRVQSAYVDPGTREIKVSAPGCKESVSEVTLSPLEEKTVSIVLERESRQTISLASQPPGADVYLNSIWMGKTPLSFETPPERSRVQLDLEGFYDLPFSTGPSSPPQITMILKPDVGSRDDIQAKARDNFYLSFAFFALSIPIPFLCSSIANDYSLLYARAPSGSSEQSRAQDSYYGWVYAGYAGVGLSVSFFTWMVVNLINYITVSNRSAG
jgi:hypothetical protein